MGRRPPPNSSTAGSSQSRSCMPNFLKHNTIFTHLSSTNVYARLLISVDIVSQDRHLWLPVPSLPATSRALKSLELEDM